VNRQYRVIAGPYRLAKRYAQSMGWDEDEFVIVTRGHQLARLDPALILSIVTVKLHELSQRIVADIQEEINRLRALWPVPTLAAA
jgi:uncharacterized small protein (DUF1192 family)